jgi:hypothetical protein
MAAIAAALAYRKAGTMVAWSTGLPVPSARASRKRAIDCVVDEHAARLEYAGGLFDHAVKVWGDLKSVGVVGEVVCVILEPGIFGRVRSCA